MTDWVFLFPGQGSQYVGMGRDFYENYSEVRELFSQASDILKMDMAALCFEGPENVLVRTENVQPAITVVNLACHIVLQLHDIYPVAAAGHSLGEYSALYVAGVMDLKDLFQLVRRRGRFMQEAAEESPGAMAAIMDLEEEKIQEICLSCGAEIANINSPEQVIITGRLETVERAVALSDEAGAKKCMMLKVSGPWHSSCMAAAREKFEPHVRSCRFYDPQIQVVNNVDAQILQIAEDVPDKLINQICGSVLWRRSMEKLLAQGYRHFVEVGPKKVLRGLLRRIDRSARVLNVEDTESLTNFLRANQ